MRKTIKDFTTEIRSKIQEYKDRAIKDLYNGNEYNSWERKNTVEYIEYIYKLGKQTDKPVVIVADDLIQYKLFYNMLFNPKINKKYTKLVNYAWFIKNKLKPLDRELYSELDRELYSELESELYSELSSELYSELDSELDSELTSDLRIELSSELDRELYSELDRELDSELEIELYRELDRELSNELYSELTSDLRRELYSELESELDSELDSELESELRSELYSELYSELDSELYSELESELDSDLKYHWLFLTSEYARVYLMWYKFMKDEFKINTKKSEQLDWLYNNVNKANIAKVFLCKKVCLVLRMPQQIIRNDRFISNVNDAAIIYPNQKIYYINGLKITEDLFKKLSKQEYTFEEWTKESNEEVKSAVLGFYQEKFGDEFMYRFLSSSLKEVDTYVDKKDEVYLEGTTRGMDIGVYTLFKGEVNGENIAYVRCYCPSTDRMFFLGVNPNNTNAKDAIASLYSIPKKLVNEITSIQRQGEVFSTNFTEKGLSLIKEMTEKDFQDIGSIDGNKYFSLIKYEY